MLEKEKINTRIKRLFFFCYILKSPRTYLWKSCSEHHVAPNLTKFPPFLPKLLITTFTSLSCIWRASVYNVSYKIDDIYLRICWIEYEPYRKILGSKSGIEHDREEKLGILFDSCNKNFIRAKHPSGFVFEANRDKSKVSLLNLCFRTLLFFFGSWNRSQNESLFTLAHLVSNFHAKARPLWT